MLDELRGALPTISAVERPPEVEVGDKLDLSRPSTAAHLSPAKVADKQHSIKAGGKGYAVVVAGEYYTPSKDSRGKVLRPYKITFNVPQLEGALSTIVKHLLLPALKKMDPEARGYRTHQVLEAEPNGPDVAPVNSLQFMDRPALESFIAQRRAPIDPAVYPDVAALREAVIDFQLNFDAEHPERFQKREQERSGNAKETAELAAMNEGVL